MASEVGPLCRRCSRETETPAHVLGSCPANMLLITQRHHRVKHLLSDLLKERGYGCYEEVYCIDTDGSSRHADIVAFPRSGPALILDPTIRYEKNEADQAEQVHQEKKAIYDKAIPFLKEKFREKHGNREFQVMGLWFGARGSVSKFTSQCLEKIGVDHGVLAYISEAILLDSLGILNFHIYGAS